MKSVPPLVLLLLVCGCEPTRPPGRDARPADEPTPAPRDEATKPQADAERPAIPPAKPSGPKRIDEAWARLGDVGNPDGDAIVDARATGGRRLEIHTQNVRTLTLDLNRLPEGVPSRGPWNLQIDQQGIEITGRRGRVLELVRSPAGRWTVTGARE